MSGHTAVLVTACGNCGAELGGAFCHVCGQRATGPDVRLHDFFHDALHEFAHVDGKIIQTVRLLITKPGMLTTEFLGGRRARYISPLRVYLTCSVLFFALAALAPIRLSFFHITYTPSRGDAPMDAAAIQRYEEEATLRASRGIVHDFPRAMFALMPVFGLFTWVLYRKARPFYAAHLSCSIHFHAFMFLALTVEVALILLAAGRIPALTWLAPVAILAYHFISLRRVFGGSRLSTAWKGVLLWVVYLSVILAAMIAIGIFSVKGTTPGKPAAEMAAPH